MGRSVSKSTLGTWLTKKAWLSLAAVVVGLLAASIGMSLLGSSVVSAQSNSAPEIYSHSRPNSVTVGVSGRWQATATDVDGNIIGWRWFLDDVKQKEYTFLPSRSAARVIDHTFSTAGTYTIKSEFFDEGGLTGSVSWSVEVTAPPSVSRVSPSSSEVNLDPGDSQTFSARATDADNNISQWEWFLDGVSKGGQSLTLTGDITRQFSHTFSTADVYTVKVEFTDSDGDSDSVSWTVYVNRPPSVARVSPSTSSINLVVGDSQTFSARATDADSNISEWEWFVDDVSKGGQSLSFTGDITREFSHTFSSAGTYTVEVEFIDDLLESDSVSWTVRADEDLEQVSVTVASNTSGRTVTVDGTDRAAPYAATWDSGSSHTLNVPSPQNISGVNSRYVYSSWSQGGSQSQTVAPTSDATYTANFTLQHFLSTRTEPGGIGIAGGGTWYNHGATATVGPAPKIAGYIFSYWRKNFQNIGTDPAGVSVTVDGPTLVEAVFTPEVTAPPSVSRVSPSSSEVNLDPGDSQTFSARATDADNNISQWEWFLDGVSKGGQSLTLTGDITRQFSHTFQTAGTYTVEVEFTDSDGDSGSVSWIVTVGPNPPSTVNVTVASSPSGRMVTVDGTNRTAPYTATWNSGSSHTLNVPSPQNITGVSSRYAFSRWSHGGSRSQTVSPTSNSTYTANFTLQHFLSTRTEPNGIGIAGGGTWHNHGATATVGPAPKISGYNFSHWSQDESRISGTPNPESVSVEVYDPTLVEAVYVVNVPPQAAGSPEETSISLKTGDRYQFTGECEEKDTSILPKRDASLVGIEWSVNGTVENERVFTSPRSFSIHAFSYTFSTSGSHTVTYTCYDGGGGSDSVTWTVQAVPNRSPTVSRVSPSGSSLTLSTGSSQTFSARATDADNNITQWEWFVDNVSKGGQSLSPTGDITRQFSHTFQTAGTYTVEVEFTDSDGDSGSVSWIVTVGPNPPSTVNVTVASSPSGRMVTVDGTNRTAPYTATWNSGSSHTLNAPSPQNILGVSSRYVFSSWSQGGSQSQTVRPTSNRTYTANFTLQHFLSTRSTPTGPGIAGGGQWYNHNSTAFVGPAPTVAGYNFSFWRKDGQSIGTDPAGVSVTVDGPTLVEAVFTPAGENRAPTIADDFSPSTESVILFAGTSQTFEARATDLDNNISSVVWYVDDVVVWDPGSTASIALTGDFPSSYDHTFSAPDTHTVKVTFTDAEGATASHSWTVQVDPPNEERAPTVERIAPEESELSLYTTQTQDFTVEATDINGDIAKWKWVVDKAGVLTDGHEEEEEFDEETGSITKEFSHPFDDDGSYTVTVTFTDSEGESGSVEWEVEVEDGPDLAVEDVEIRATSNPAHLGGFIQVEMQLRNHSDTTGVAYDLPFYIKNTGLRFLRQHELEREFVPEVDIILAPPTLYTEYSSSPLVSRIASSLY